MMSASESNTILAPRKSRRLLALTLVFMAIGTGSELFLIDHYEDAWQIVPMVLIGTSLLLFLVLIASKSRLLINIFRGLMVFCAISGIVGTCLHLNGNMEFEREIHATASDWDVFTASLSGATPTLAPGSMVVFGLIGYVYTLLTIDKQK